MEDQDFFDTLYQLWAKTSGAHNSYWQPIRHPNKSVFYIESVQEGEDGSHTRLANYVSEQDADFITAIHGCLPDLVRRLHDAVDEAERLDVEMDVCQGRLAAAEMRVYELEGELSGAAH